MRGILAALLVAMTVFLAVGCGGSSNDAAGTTEAATTEATVDTSTEAMTDTDTTATDTTASDTSTTANGLSEGCQQVADFSTNFSNALAAAGAGGGGAADLAASAKAYEEAADSAPEEIREAFKTLAVAYAAYAKALDGVDLSSGTPSPETIAKLVVASKALNTEGLPAATTKIAEWVSANCTGG